MKKEKRVHGDGSDPSVNPQPEKAAMAMEAFLSEAETVTGTLDDLIIEAFDDGAKGRLYILRFQVGRMVEAGRALGGASPSAAAPAPASPNLEQELAEAPLKAHLALDGVCLESADLLVCMGTLLGEHLEEMPGWPGKGLGFTPLARGMAGRLMATFNDAFNENMRNAGKGGGR